MKDDLQKKLIQFQVLESNLKLIQEREEFTAKHLEDLHRTKAAIEDLNRTGDALIPIGSGNFVHGTISDKNNIIVGIGGGVAVKKTRKDAVEILDDRIKEMEKIINELSEQGQNVISELGKLQSEIEKIKK